MKCIVPTVVRSILVSPPENVCVAPVLSQASKPALFTIATECEGPYWNSKQQKKKNLIKL